MPARLIRKVANLIYAHPGSNSLGDVSQVKRSGQFAQLKIALVADQFTTDCLSIECQVQSLTPRNYEAMLRSWKPDFIFIESTFHGVGGVWRYELAKQPAWLLWTKPTAIYRLIHFAKVLGIPTVFWNKDDGAYFDDFIDVAKCCDVVFTTDENCLTSYRASVGPNIPVQVMMMPYQPAFHSFTGFDFKVKRACFTGSYYRRVLSGRRAFLDFIFATTAKADVPIDVYDRNHDRLSRHFAFRFPRMPHLVMHPKVTQLKTALIYKEHISSINVNSITDSETMVSRRLLEILACGGIVVSNPSRAITKHFADFCHIVSNEEEGIALFARLKEGPTTRDFEMAKAGANYVAQHHTWAHRLEQICRTVHVFGR